MKKFIAAGAVIAACASFLPSAFARTTVPGNQGVDRFMKVKHMSRRSLIIQTIRSGFERGPRRGTRNKSFSTDPVSSSSSSSSMSSSTSSSSSSSSETSSSSSSASSAQ